jgi:hypothetical protein
MKYSRRIRLCCVLICLLLLPSVGKSAAAADPSLVLHWKLDGDFRDTSGRLFVGALPGGKKPLDGAIDDLRIYKRALSAAEVSQLYNQR